MEAAKTCPDCKLNQVQPPFDHCLLCQMLGSFFLYEMWYQWAKKRKLDASNWRSCHRAYVQWRRRVTLADVENLRKTFWEAKVA